LALTHSKITNDIESTTRRIINGLLLLFAIFFAIEAPRGAHYFDKIKYDGSLWAYGTSLFFFMAGEGALLTAIFLAYYKRHDEGDKRSGSWLPWASAGAAFVWLGCDKMFAIHERIGMAIARSSLAPFNHFSPSMLDGFVLGVYGIMAIIFAIIFLKGPLVTLQARKYFILGYLFMAFSVFHVATEGFVNYDVVLRDSEMMEKVFETLSGWAFTATFLSVMSMLMIRILRLPDYTGEAGRKSTSKTIDTAKSKSPGSASRK